MPDATLPDDLDPDEDEELDDDGYATVPSGTALPVPRLLVGASVLQLVAAALCVVAPFLAVWTLRGQDVLDQAAGTVSEISTNGWGSSSNPENGQGPMFGLIVTLAGVLVLAAAVARIRETMLLRARSTDEDVWWPTEPARSLGVAGSALLLGGAGSFLLTAINVVAHQDELGVPSADASIGVGTWLAIAAWVVSAFAMGLSESATRRLQDTLLA